MTITDKGVVFAAEEGSDRQSCTFPSVCVLPSGRWVCAFRAAPTKIGTVGQRPLVTWSDDEGKTWREPTTPFKPPKIKGKPGLFRSAGVTAMGGDEVLAIIYWVDHSDPSLPFFNEKTEGLLDSRLFLSTSPDGGATWPKPRLLDLAPFTCPTPITGPALKLANGDLAVQFELNKHYNDPAVWRHASVLMFSRDGGRTWPEHSLASSDPENRLFYWDQRPAVLDDGRILDLFWTYDNKAAVYLNIHACESRDNGRTWSAMWDTGVPGQPAPAVSLPGGRIAMVYVDRTSTPVIKARVSADGGRTWPQETELLLHGVQTPSQTEEKKKMQDAWAEMAKFSLGLPATARLANGDILVTFYAGSRTDCTAIRWLRIRPE